ncbi:MAG: uroporphyrinogen-III synthase [Pseudohongiellaceae bacterium]
MFNKSTLPSSLNAKVVAIPESRQLDILADLFVRRGAHVIRVPLISILDAPDPEPVNTWLREFIDDPPSHFVLLTGEGLRRLAGFATRAGILDEFVAVLARVNKICRGPKPGRALGELGLKPDASGKEPTTDGIIATLEDLDIDGRIVAVQLYGEDPNTRLIEYLTSRGARVRQVSPYIYAAHSDEEKVLSLIDDIASGSVDVVTFTSQPQFKRLVTVAAKYERENGLREGLARTVVAAVGPVVAKQLEDYGVAVSVMPADAYFMKPMVSEIARFLQNRK